MCEYSHYDNTLCNWNDNSVANLLHLVTIQNAHTHQDTV